MSDRHYDRESKNQESELLWCFAMDLSWDALSQLAAQDFGQTDSWEIYWRSWSKSQAWMPPAQLHLLYFPLCFQSPHFKPHRMLQIFPLTNHFVIHFPSITLNVPSKFCPWFNICQQDNTDSKCYYQFKLKVTEAGFAGPGFRNFAINFLILL